MNLGSSLPCVHSSCNTVKRRTEEEEQNVSEHKCAKLPTPTTKQSITYILEPW